MSSQAENYTEFISLITNKVWRQRIVKIVGQRALGILAEKVMNAYKTTPESVNPDKKDVFKAINLVPIDNVKVVIVGQDPFYGDRTRGKVKGEEAEQGVLLLNSILTVRQREANSHKRWGWEKVTDAIIKIANDNCQEKKRNVVFLLCGLEAFEKALRIESEYAKVYYAYHPLAESRQMNKLEKKDESLESLTDYDLNKLRRMSDKEMSDKEKSQNEYVYVKGNKIVRNNTNKVFPDDDSNKSRPGYPKTPLIYTTYKSKYMPPNSDYKYPLVWKDRVFHGAAYLKHAKKELGIDVNFNLDDKEDVIQKKKDSAGVNNDISEASTSKTNGIVKDEDEAVVQTPESEERIRDRRSLEEQLRNIK